MDNELVNAVLPILQEKRKCRLNWFFFFRFLTKYSTVDDYIEFIIEHIPLMHFNLDSTIHLSNYAIYDCIEKLQSLDAIIKLLDYFIENTQILRDIHIDDLIPSIVGKALNLSGIFGCFGIRCGNFLRKSDIISPH
ncbi:hypothetical protein CMV37_26135, partial [Bacillus cereus]